MAAATATPGMAANAIGVLLVEDAPEARLALKKLLVNGSTNGHARFAVTGEAGNGAEAVMIAREVSPQAVVISLEEPVSRPLKSIEILTSASPETPVIVVSSLADKEYLRRAMLAGARDFVNRPVSTEDLQRSITSVVEAEQKRRSLSRDVLETGQRGELIAVFSGKGGVGKSTIATNLAVGMALEAPTAGREAGTGNRVALVDLDLAFGDVAIMLDVTPERTIADLVPLIEKLDPELLRGFLQVHSSGLKVLCAPTRVEEGEAVTPERLRRILDVLARTFDYVILDLPRSLDDRVVTALDAASLVLLVTTYDVPCLKSTRVCLDLLRSWRYSEEKVKLVINHANRGGPTGAGYGAGEAEGALEYPIFWKLPSDAVVASSSTNQGKPFVQLQPTTKLAQNVTGLGAILGGARRNGRGRFARLMG